MHDPLPQKILVHSVEGDYYMDADSWPKMMTADDHIIGTQENSLEGQLSDEGGGHGWESPSRKKKSKGAKKKVVVATRVSSRIPRDGIPIADKAVKRARERDELTGNPFTILNNTSNDSLKEIALDLDIDDSFLMRILLL